jgi:membrane protein
VKIAPLKRAISEAAAKRSRRLIPAPDALPASGSARGLLLRAWFIAGSAVEGFIEHNDALRAAALTYIVGLSFVPMLALAFSLVKGFGLTGQLQSLMEKYLALGSSAVMQELMELINHVNPAALGIAGGLFLLGTVISAMGTVEQGLNIIFRAARSRGLLRKFSDYLSVVLTVPLLLVAALALTTLFSIKLGPRPGLTEVTPYLFNWAGFLLLFSFFPYTKVRLRPALLGSLVTAVVFQVAQWGYVRFQIGVAKYKAIYGAFAMVPVFLVWIYFAWSIVLFGAELTAALQRGVPAIRVKRRFSDFERAVALSAMVAMAERHAAGGKSASCEELAAQLNAPPDSVRPVIEMLKRAGLLVEDAKGKPRRSRPISLCRAPSAITVDEILTHAAPDELDNIADPRIRRILETVREAGSNAVKSLTLADLAKARKPED